MLNSSSLTRIFKLTHTLIISALFFLYSCMPTGSTPSIDSGNSTDTGNSTTVYGEPAYPLNGTFIQEGATRSLTNISIPVDFGDSFLIRGKNLSQYLRNIPNTTKFCLVGRYNYVSGSNKFLILSAKSKSYTDLVNKTTEFYLQAEPSNDTVNQNDCLTYNLTSTLYSGVTNPSAAFSFLQLCTDCTTSVTSSGLKLYFTNGEEVPTITTSSLLLTLSGSTSSSGNSCSESTACSARGYDCCLQGQCVNDGAVRPAAITLDGFLAAQEDVRLNPNRFVVYPQFYFVCETRPEGSTTGSTTGGSSSDPDYDAAIRLQELKQLYDCVNKVDGEFSYCTVKYTGASSSIPGVFSAGTNNYFDDVNFSSLNPTLATGDYINNIVKIIYAGQTLYSQNSVPLTAGSFVPGSANDNLTAAQSVNITAALPANARDANLYLTYKVDGTCEKLSTSLAKCSKTYIHASSDTTSTMWHDSSKTFLLPSYADASSGASLVVKVSGVVVPEDTTTWTKYQSPNRIVFHSSYTLYQNQTVEISYFVTSGVAALVKLKSEAQAQVNTMCTCSSSVKCGLKPILDSDNSSIVNYECTYGGVATTEPPVNQTVYVSNKNIAHRYFDQNGVSYDEDYGSALDQELAAFSYTNNDVLKPNNVTSYVGFNEIYGSFAKTGTYISKPAKKVSVKKDKYYDLVVSSGVFSSCLTCGGDYYTSLQKIFPQNFAGMGGGYTPDTYESRRENSSSIYRADDLAYGRACFVPATMIPWTHITASTPRDQRRTRLAGQHFMFANGYNRDWYGFDYGSLIGSFDGVNWFSIGNQRRIKATTSKLYLAVNAYLGDLNVDSNFTVAVSETSVFSSTIADHDTETDGAQCQRSHYCSNDNDCFAQLGYDYTCQNVSGITTNWPQFDATGAEIVGSSTKTLASIVGGTNGQSKRCVYRGKGTPCLPNLNLAGSAQTYNGSSLVGNLTCSPNNSCLPVTTANRFNDRIARFANTPVSQNASGVGGSVTDTVGMGARIILRPYDYYGTKSIPSAAQTSFTANSITALCVPGKDITSAVDSFDLNARHPSNRTDSSDKLFTVGPASSSVQSTRALNACPATDAAGNSLQIYSLPLGGAEMNRFSISQNLSSNLLDLAPLRNLNIFSSTAGSQITAVGYQRNACLRAPGASCFSDMECAPSSFIASKALSAGLASVLNTAEAKFWEEGLVCGNSAFKNVSAGVLNPNYDIKKNVCCREMGKTLSVYTQTDTSAHLWCDAGTNTPRVAGVNIAINSPNRYSRVHTVYDKMTCDRADLLDTTKSFALSVAAPNSVERMKQILRQYRTLDALNQRTCCTQNWVRSFHTENGGGHAFAKTKMQNIDKEMFKHISWAPDDETTITPAVNDAPFECSPSQFANSSCEVKNLTPAEEEKYLSWASSLELIGIPQVAIKTNDQIYKLVSDTQGALLPTPEDHLLPLTDSNGKLMLKPNSSVTADFKEGPLSTDLQYYSAANYDNMNMTGASPNSLKKVFSENEFNCCIPSNQQLPDTVTASQCCTGHKETINGAARCCLPAYTDLTVYLNRYVSSEGRGLPDSAYDPATGYIKDPGQVQLIAAQKNLCCSGRTMTGLAVSQLLKPLANGVILAPDTLNTTRRFNYRTDEVDNNNATGSVGSFFDAGVRWNNHVYCVP